MLSCDSGWLILPDLSSLNQANIGMYSYTLDAQTEGLVAFFLDYQIRSKSTFVINQLGLQTKHYQNFERDGKKIKISCCMWLKCQHRKRK
jgi:hypothetical protein